MGLGANFESDEDISPGPCEEPGRPSKGFRVSFRKEPDTPTPGIPPPQQPPGGEQKRPAAAEAEHHEKLSDVTRWLCAASYLRPDHATKLAKFCRFSLRFAPRALWILLTKRNPYRRQRALDKLLTDVRPTDTQLPVPLGHEYVRWVRKRVGSGHPVPPHGFHLGPVLQTAASAEGLTHVRRVLLVLALAAAVVAGTAQGPLIGLAVAPAGAWAACYADRILACSRFRKAPWARGLRTPDLRWWVGPGRRRALRRTPSERNGLVVPYALREHWGDRLMHHIVGAGTVSSDDAVGIDVAAADTEESRSAESEEERLVREAFRSVDDILGRANARKPVAHFTPEELHNHVAGELDDLLDPRPTHHPDNRLDIFDVAAVSAERWRDISTAEWESLLTLARKGTGAKGAATEVKESGRLLCARIVSRDWELVTSLYVGFAYEHHFLRVTLRPHVTNPVHPTLRDGVRAAERAGLGWHLRTALNAFFDVFALLDRLRPMRASSRPKADPGRGPVSLREVYSSLRMDDMLQYDDARRHVDWLQRCVFRSVLGFLQAHNVDVSAFLKQATYILQNSGTVNTGVVNHGSMGNVQNQPGAHNSTTMMNSPNPHGGNHT